MRIKDGVPYLNKEEMAKCLSTFCTPEISRCQYNGKDEDFEECEAYKIISAFSPKLKNRGAEEKHRFDSAKEKNPDAAMPCPICHEIMVYGGPLEHKIANMLKDNEYKIERLYVAKTFKD